MYNNVRDFGAKGDGITDDTLAIVKAMNELPERGGVIYFPPGVYLTKSIKCKNYTTYMGNSSWGYKEHENLGDFNGNAVIMPINDEDKMLFDLENCIGTRIIGLTLDGKFKGNEMHGVYSKHPGIEQNICIEDCRIVHFTGSGVRLDHCWVFAVRRCLIIDNNLHGIDATKSYDGWVIDNQLTANKGWGLYSGESFAKVAVTANRVEWNREGGISLHYTSTPQITGCCFDCNFGPGLQLTEALTMTVTGNIFCNNGCGREKDSEKNCHLIIKNSKGITVTGNSFLHSEKQENLNPSFGIVFENLSACVITQNAISTGAKIETLVDKGSHNGAIVIKDNA